jgi:nicotinamide mononucleotide adenylyltransferase
MFEMASDYVRLTTDFELMGGYLSPVSDDYQKADLAQGQHRINMCLSATESSSWVMVDPFEVVNRDPKGKPKFIPTADVLRHFDQEINVVLGGIRGVDGTVRKARIALLAGADLIMSMGKALESKCFPKLTKIGNSQARSLVEDRSGNHLRHIWRIHH